MMLSSAMEVLATGLRSSQRMRRAHRKTTQKGHARSQCSLVRTRTTLVTPVRDQCTVDFEIMQRIGMACIYSNTCSLRLCSSI